MIVLLFVFAFGWFLGLLVVVLSDCAMEENLKCPQIEYSARSFFDKGCFEKRTI
jgi:hypothetical protein